MYSNVVGFFRTLYIWFIPLEPVLDLRSRKAKDSFNSIVNNYETGNLNFETCACRRTSGSSLSDVRLMKNKSSTSQGGVFLCLRLQKLRRKNPRYFTTFGNWSCLYQWKLQQAGVRTLLQECSSALIHYFQAGQYQQFIGYKLEVLCRLGQQSIYSLLIIKFTSGLITWLKGQYQAKVIENAEDHYNNIRFFILW